MYHYYIVIFFSCFYLLCCCTVLVAHNGFNFDYRILAAEIERQKLTAQFIKADLGFADTLYELRKVSYISTSQ